VGVHNAADERQATLYKELLKAAETVVQQNWDVQFVLYPKDEGLRRTQMKAKKLIQFRKGGKIFELREGEPPRMAVTGFAITDPVIFNLNTINDPKIFSYGDAIALWIHELGHKVKDKLPDVTQQEIDEAAARVKGWFQSLSHIYKFGEREILVINPVPAYLEGQLGIEPYLIWPNRISPTFAAIVPGGLEDLTPKLEAALDKKLIDRYGPYYANSYEIGNLYHEIRRKILQVLPIKSSGDELNLRLELRTTRYQKNEKLYVITASGPNHFTSANIKLSHDLKKLEVERYINEPPPPPLVDDARAEVWDVAPTPEGGIQGRIKIESDNIKHYHATGYPTAYIELLTLINGEPKRLEAKVTWSMRESQGLGLMPAETYQKTALAVGHFQVERGQFEGEKSEVGRILYDYGIGDDLHTDDGDLEILGVISRFFKLGSYSAEEQRRVQLKEVRTLRVPKYCEKILNPN
jgi:hypothetical protein